MVSSLNLNYSFSDTHTLPYNIKRIQIQDRFELYLDPDPDSKGTKDEQEILLTRFFIKGFTDLWQMKSQSRYFVILTFDHHGTVRWFWIGRFTLAFHISRTFFSIWHFTIYNFSLSKLPVLRRPSKIQNILMYLENCFDTNRFIIYYAYPSLLYSMTTSILPKYVTVKYVHIHKWWNCLLLKWVLPLLQWSLELLEFIYCILLLYILFL